MNDFVEQTILKGIARSLWVWAWSRGFMGTDSDDPHEPEHALIGGTNIGVWDDRQQQREAGVVSRDQWDVPRTPREAFVAAEAVRDAWGTANRDLYPSLSAMLEEAMIADEGIDDLREDIVLHFGKMLGAMALGAGVSWFDNHEAIDMRIPTASCHLETSFGEVMPVISDETDTHGHQLVWHTTSGRGRAPVSEFGANPRIETRRDGVLYEDPTVAEVGISDLGTIGDVIVDTVMELDPFVGTARVTSPGVYTSPDSDVTFHVLGDVPAEEIAKADEIIRDTTETLSSASEVEVRNGRERKWGRLIYINPSDRTYKKHTFVLVFGPYASEYWLIYADGLEDAFEEGMDQVARSAPGLLANDQVAEAYRDLVKDFVKEHGREPEEEEEYALREEAEADTSRDGQGNYIDSDEWSIVAEDPSPEQLRELAHR